jgi:hypothetical protein
VGGKPFEPLPLGNLRLHYLRIPASAAVVADPAARFLLWRGGRFVDATGEVRSGAMAPAFHDNRPPQ